MPSKGYRSLGDTSAYGTVKELDMTKILLVP